MVPLPFNTGTLPGSRVSQGRLRTCSKCKALKQPEGGLDMGKDKWRCASCARIFTKLKH